jgi:IPT/TIG domain
MVPWPSALRGHRCVRTVIALLVAGGAIACGGGSPTTPTPTAPVITSISPSSGSTLGGTTVTINGANFANGATVTFGGTPAFSVMVASATQITAVTSQHGAGSVDVAVTLSGRTATSAAAFSFSAPQTSNAPPVVSLTAQGSRSDEPESFADLDEEITVSTIVQDNETSADAMAYTWSADIGTITGAGKTVRWRAPASGATPLKATITVTVVETYQATNDAGAPVSLENRTAQSIAVDVHDSVKEVGDMATLFLVNFSKTDVPVDTVMKDFWPACSGTDDERSDVENNRDKFTITSYTIGAPSVTIDFDSHCDFRNRAGDACSSNPIKWTSITKATGETGTVEGSDDIASVFRSGRWWLCSSDFDGHIAATARGFIR